MKFFFHYSVEDFTNSYILGPDGGGDALLIDPTTFDKEFLTMIEDNNLYIKWILITRPQKLNPRGLKTLKKIYNAEIYSRPQKVLDFPSNPLRQGQKIQLGELQIESWAFPEYSTDSLTFLIQNWLFTGDLLSAGHMGNTSNSFGKVNLMESLEKRIFSLDTDLIIFPGEGPPTTLRSEKLFNERLKKDSTPGYVG
ncbi:MAG: hypothetical protein A2Z96_00260 [Spirochaetes bacterium GWB1_48_6]|nr:MAG: hypothetical protein A2Z96_00260 [Spirochaetes bacterium GWB1_48_6]